MNQPNRPEGVYCWWETWPPEGGILVNNMLHLERVNGDGTVTSWECARSETPVILEFLQKAKVY